MNYASDFRRIARDGLRGKWSVAVITCFIAYLFGAGIASSGTLGTFDTESLGDTFSELQMGDIWLKIEVIFSLISLVLVVFALVAMIMSGAIKFGYALFNLKLINKKRVDVSDLFSQKNRVLDGVVMNFLTGLYTFLWTLLFIIPGIVKAYSYAMTPYIMAENPGMSANDAITESREIMDGNKWRLVCLGLSFIGWDLLCALPTFILSMFIITASVVTDSVGLLIWIFPAMIPSLVASLFVSTYKEAAYAAFYQDVKRAPSIITE